MEWNGDLDKENGGGKLDMGIEAYVGTGVGSGLDLENGLLMLLFDCFDWRGEIWVAVMCSRCLYELWVRGCIYTSLNGTEMTQYLDRNGAKSKHFYLEILL